MSDEKINYIEVIGDTKNVWDGKRNRKYIKIWCKYCHSYSWIREDNLSSARSCGCLSRGYRSKWLHLKGRTK